MAQDELEIRYPKNSDHLIEEGGDVRTLFGDWIKGKWFSYVDGYKAAADLLVDKIEGRAPQDILVLPIVFMQPKNYSHFANERIALLETELSPSGREVAYILDAHKQFGG